MDVPAPAAQAGAVKTPYIVNPFRSSWLLKMTAEVALISVGVFLALMGDEWRERAHAREAAQASLQRLRVELVRNRKAIEAVKDYHRSIHDSLQRHLAADPKERGSHPVQIRGLQPSLFEHTAWDLALSTQSLGNIDPMIAFELTRIYGVQSRYDELTLSILQAIYARPIADSMEALSYYYGDAVLWDTALLQMYKDVILQIDRALRQQK